jgi:ribose 5-phosphate isomerase B
MLRIFVGSDHAGYNLKVAVKEYLMKSGKYEVHDVGTDDKSSCHYPEYALRMSKLIKPEDRGILVCGSGIGIGIAANKCQMPCATAHDEFTAAECGKHFNVMAMGERVVAVNMAYQMIEEFLKACAAKKEEN